MDTVVSNNYAPSSFFITEFSCRRDHLSAIFTTASSKLASFCPKDNGLCSISIYSLSDNRCTTASTKERIGMIINGFTCDLVPLDSDGDADVPRKKQENKHDNISYRIRQKKKPINLKQNCSEMTTNFEMDNKASYSSKFCNNFSVFVANLQCSTGIDKVGCQLWSSSIVLADFLYFHYINHVKVGMETSLGARNCFDVRVLVELGCGTGFLGPIYKLIFKKATVLLTDSEEEVLKLCKITQIINEDRKRMRYGGSKVEVRYLNWQWISDSSSLCDLQKKLRGDNSNYTMAEHSGDAPANHNSTACTSFEWSDKDMDYLLAGKVDLFTACDVLYDCEGVDRFAHTVYRLLQMNPQSRFLMAQGYRLNILTPWNNKPTDIFVEYFKDFYVSTMYDVNFGTNNTCYKHDNHDCCDLADQVFLKPANLQFFDLCVLRKAPRNFYLASNHCAGCNHFEFSQPFPAMQRFPISKEEANAGSLSSSSSAAAAFAPLVNSSISPTTNVNRGKNSISSNVAFLQMQHISETGGILKNLSDHDNCCLMNNDVNDNCDNNCHSCKMSSLQKVEESLKYVEIWELRLHHFTKIGVEP